MCQMDKTTEGQRAADSGMKRAGKIIGQTMVDIEPGAAIATEILSITPDDACHEPSLSREYWTSSIGEKRR